MEMFPLLHWFEDNDVHIWAREDRAGGWLKLLKSRRTWNSQQSVRTDEASWMREKHLRVGWVNTPVITHTVDFNACFPSNMNGGQLGGTGKWHPVMKVVAFSFTCFTFLSFSFHIKSYSETTELFLFMLRLKGMDVQTGRTWQGQRSLLSSVKRCSICLQGKYFIPHVDSGGNTGLSCVIRGWGTTETQKLRRYDLMWCTRKFPLLGYWIWNFSSTHNTVLLLLTNLNSCCCGAAGWPGWRDRPGVLCECVRMWCREELWSPNPSMCDCNAIFNAFVSLCFTVQKASPTAPPHYQINYMFPV